MNERIKELAKQAFIYSCEFAHGPDYSPHNPYNELIEKERYDTKFAQLIVEECAKRAEVYAYMSPNFNALAEELRSMIGVAQ